MAVNFKFFREKTFLKQITLTRESHPHYSGKSLIELFPEEKYLFFGYHQPTKEWLPIPGETVTVTLTINRYGKDSGVENFGDGLLLWNQVTHSRYWFQNMKLQVFEKPELDFSLDDKEDGIFCLNCQKKIAQGNFCHDECRFQYVENDTPNTIPSTKKESESSMIDYWGGPNYHAWISEIILNPKKSIEERLERFEILFKTMETENFLDNVIEQVINNSFGRKPSPDENRMQAQAFDYMIEILDQMLKRVEKRKQPQTREEVPTIENLTAEQPKEKAKQKTSWEIMLEEAAVLDAERERRDKKIQKGTKVKWMLVTFYLKNKEGGVSGFAIEEYELPFDQQKMKDDLKEWKALEYFHSVEKEEITTPPPPTPLEPVDSATTDEPREEKDQLINYYLQSSAFEEGYYC